MRLRTILEGSEKTPIPWDLILSNCSDIFKNLYSHNPHSAFIHTGTFYKDYVHIQTRERKPLDTPKAIQDLVDMWFVEHGFVALRSNSLFTRYKDLPNPNALAKVDLAFIVIPENGFKATFSENVVDFFKVVSSLEFFNKFKAMLSDIASHVGDDSKTYLRNEFIKAALNKHSDEAKEVLEHMISDLMNKTPFDTEKNFWKLYNYSDMNDLPEVMLKGGMHMIRCTKQSIHEFMDIAAKYQSGGLRSK